MSRYIRIKRDILRVAKIRGRETVVTIGEKGLAFRVLGDDMDRTVPLSWEELFREGGMLDAVELEERPLLAKCVAANCGGPRR